MRSEPAVRKELVEKPGELLSEPRKRFVGALLFGPLTGEVTEQLVVETHFYVLRPARETVGNGVERQTPTRTLKNAFGD
jgi:hypothetical protein